MKGFENTKHNIPKMLATQYTPGYRLFILVITWPPGAVTHGHGPASWEYCTAYLWPREKNQNSHSKYHFYWMHSTFVLSQIWTILHWDGCTSTPPTPGPVTWRLFSAFLLPVTIFPSHWPWAWRCDLHWPMDCEQPRGKLYPSWGFMRICVVWLGLSCHLPGEELPQGKMLLLQPGS